MRLDTGPERLVIELTYRCGLRCHHCYVLRSARAAGTTRALGPQRSARFWGRILEQLPIGTPVHFTGGEVFEHGEALAVIGLAARRHPTSLVTNGQRLDPQTTRALAALRPRQVTVSVLGTAPVHDAIAGRPDAYSRAMGALQALTAALGTDRAGANLVLLPETVDSLEPVASALDRIGVQDLTIQLWDGSLTRSAVVAGTPALPSSDGLPWTRPAARRARRILESLVASKRTPLRVRLPSGMSPEALERALVAEQTLEGYRCGEVFTTMRCSPTGLAYGCDGTRPFGSLAERSVGELWRSPAALALRARAGIAALPASCAGCCKLRTVAS